MTEIQGIIIIAQLTIIILMLFKAYFDTGGEE